MIVESLTPKTDIAASGLTIVYVTAPWCAPCKVYGPQVAQISEAYPNVKFVKVDADAAADGLNELTTSLKVALRSVPTTLCFENGELRDTFSGARKDLLQKFLDQFDE